MFLQAKKNSSQSSQAQQQHKRFVHHTVIHLSFSSSRHFSRSFFQVSDLLSGTYSIQTIVEKVIEKASSRHQSNDLASRRFVISCIL